MSERFKKVKPEFNNIAFQRKFLFAKKKTYKDEVERLDSSTTTTVKKKSTMTSFISSIHRRQETKNKIEV
jgi:hypothetical protein